MYVTWHEVLTDVCALLERVIEELRVEQRSAILEQWLLNTSRLEER
jgi:hypothetical protein